MPAQFEQLPGERILISTFSADFDHSTESPAVLEETIRLLDQQSQPVIFIMDIRGVSFSLEDVMSAANMATRQTEVFKHPNILENIMVTESRMIDLAMRGLNSPMFGNVKVRVFGTREEALDYALQQLDMRKAM